MSEISRRNFLKVLGVTGATLAGCSTQPPEKLMPYWVPPEEIIPGKAIEYATTCQECPAGCGMQVRTIEGRAIKIEGNAEHPINSGGLCARGQAALQGLYNPDRIRQPLFRNPRGTFLTTSWEKAEERLTGKLSESIRKGKADRIVFLTPHLNGSLGDLITRWMAEIGSTQHFSYEPFAYEALQEAAQLIFGRSGLPRYAIEKADLLLSFGADFLETWRSPVSQAKGFAKMRVYHHGHIGKFYYVGPRLSMTASNADRWIMAKPGTELFLALAMIHQILAEGLNAPLPADEGKRLMQLVAPFSPTRVSRLTEISEGRIFRLTHAFANAKSALAFAGDVASSGDNATATSVAVCLLNYVTGNIGKTVHFEQESGKHTKNRYQDMLSLIELMKAGQVEALLLYGVNPIFTLPQAAQFKAALKRVPFVASFSGVLDESTAEAHLVLPDHHALESWGDSSPEAGVYGLSQPVMRPLYETKSSGDVLLSVAQKLSKPLPWSSHYDFLRDRWKAHQKQFSPMTDFEDFWQESIQKGGRWQSVPQKPVQLSERLFSLHFEAARIEGDDEDGFILHSYPSSAFFDGRGADKSWLQELPDPITKLTWENWVEVHPQTAHKLALLEGDWVEVISSHGRVELPVHLYEGLRHDTVAIALGQGHTHLGRYAKNRGANAMVLLPAKPEARSGGINFLSVRVQLKSIGKNTRMATVSGSDRQGERGIAQAIPLTELMSRTHEMEKEEEPNIYPPHEHALHRWGMGIDLQSCTGCSACVVACSAENNLPVVGKERVITGHEMSWMRIERYVEGEGDRLFTHFLPMLCQQCDNAPCEPVCPVYATYHNDEGLNVQVYNRCIGVRYCANNCPYKVRRFNWEASDFPEPLHLQLNPELSVRAQGVMEKCTFCVQRIKGVQDQAKDENRTIRDGEIKPACAQSCPTQAIVFGDLNDPKSRVSKQAQHRRGYHVLEHLNTKPAINYLKRIQQDAEQV